MLAGDGLDGKDPEAEELVRLSIWMVLLDEIGAVFCKGEGGEGGVIAGLLCSMGGE